VAFDLRFCGISREVDTWFSYSTLRYSLRRFLQDIDSYHPYQLPSHLYVLRSHRIQTPSLYYTNSKYKTRPFKAQSTSHRHEVTYEHKM